MGRSLWSISWVIVFGLAGSSIRVAEGTGDAVFTTSVPLGGGGNFLLTVEDDSSFTISVGGSVWFASAPVALHEGSCWYLSAPQAAYGSWGDDVGQLVTSGRARGAGLDGVYGPYERYTVSFATSPRTCAGGESSQPPTRIDVEYRVYAERSMVEFTQTFVDGVVNASSHSPFRTVASFPSFDTSPDRSRIDGLRTLSWQGLWDHGTLEVGLDHYIGGRQGGVPLLFWDALESVPTNVVVLSPLDNFMTGYICAHRDRSDPDSMDWMTGPPSRLDCGPTGMLKEVPAGHSQRYVMYFGGGGITDTLYGWGSALLDRSSKLRYTSREDPTISLLGYWTDNGAYYYYNPIPKTNYQETMRAVGAYHADVGLPVGYYQLDSWWYTQEKKKDPNVTCTLFRCGGGVVDWEARQDIFPDGMEAVSDFLGKPLVLHNRYWSNENVYTNFSFYFGKLEALPMDNEFWPYLLGQAKNWGMLTYEQDWLVTQYSEMAYTQDNVYASRKWLIDMGDGAT